MRYPHILMILTTLLMFVLVSCEDDYYTESGYQTSLVVEGWIEDGEFPVVILTRSVPIMTEAIAIDSLWGYVVRWATVTVSCGDSSVVLTGKYDDRYFPPYIYTTGRMRGESGKVYSLNVAYKEFHAEGKTYIPESKPLDSLRIDKVADNDTLYTITACFTDNTEEKNYYQFFVRTGNYSRQFLAAYLGSVNDNVLTGYTEVPIYQGHQFGKKKYTPYFVSGDTVAVKLAHLDSQSYSFWNEYNKALSLKDNMMFPKSTNLPSNINGGIGYWCGYGITTAYTIIP